MKSKHNILQLMEHSESSVKGEEQKECREIETGFPDFYFNKTILKRYSGVRKGFL